MRKGSQNIYETGYKDRDIGSLLPPGKRPPIVDAWSAEKKRKARQSFFFFLVLTLSVILIAVTVIQQYMLTTRVHTDNDISKPQSLETVDRTHLKALDFTSSPQAESMLGDLIAITPQDIPEDEELPFDAQWIKQAAYHVILAEKAYKEERLEAALIDYEKALKIYPNLRGIHRYMGLIYLQLQDYPAAAKAFERSTNTRKASHGVLNNLGVSYLALKEYDHAEEYFLKALRINPEYALAYLNLATLHVRAGNKQKASGYFKEYHARKPEDLKATQAYASILMDLQSWTPAVRLLEEVRQAAPELAPVYFRLAQALSHTSEKDKAILALRRGSVLVDPRTALAWLSRPTFDALRNTEPFQVLIAELSAPEEE